MIQNTNEVIRKRLLQGLPILEEYEEYDKHHAILYDKITAGHSAH